MDGYIIQIVFMLLTDRSTDNVKSYRFVRVNLDPPKGTQRVPGTHFENHYQVTMASSLCTIAMSVIRSFTLFTRFCNVNEVRMVV